MGETQHQIHLTPSTFFFWRNCKLLLNNNEVRIHGTFWLGLFRDNQFPLAIFITITSKVCVDFEDLKPMVTWKVSRQQQNRVLNYTQFAIIAVASVCGFRKKTLAEVCFFFYCSGLGNETFRPTLYNAFSKLYWRSCFRHLVSNYELQFHSRWAGPL